MSIHFCRVSILILKIIVANGDILRLPCKYEADFISESGSVLTGAVITSFPDQDNEECRLSCLRNHQCESFSSKDFGRGCELNNKTSSDNETQLIAKEGWSCRGTRKNELLVSNTGYRILIVLYP